MKIIVIGRGQVGSALYRHLNSSNEVLHWLEDIDDLSLEKISEFQPAWIINAAGKTDLAWCEANAREAVRCNVEAPVRLSQRIREFRAQSGSSTRFIHFSSGCVWDGPYDQDGKPFAPRSPASPAALYSWTKVAADAIMMQEDPDNIAIIRGRQVYSNEAAPRNTLVKLLRYPRLIDNPNSMTSLEVIEKTVDVVLGSHKEWSGIWNVYDMGVVTPYEVGRMLWKAGLRDEPQITSKAELDSWHKPKRVDTVLYDERFERLVSPDRVEMVLDRTIEQLAEALKEKV